MVPPGGLGLAAQIFVGLSSVLLMVLLVIEVLLAREIGSNGLSTRTSTMADIELIVVTGAGIGLVVSIVVNLVLLYRLAANGAKLIPAAADHRPHWAVTGWFVPIMNLFRPYQMAKQVWRSSASSDAGSPQAPEPELFKLWWGLTIASWIGDRLAAASEPETVEALADDYWLAACVSFLSVATGLAYLFVLRALIERQERGIAAPARAPVPTRA